MEQVLGIKLEEDDTGRFEEFPAFVSTVLGLEFAYLETGPGLEAQLLILPEDWDEKSETEVNISEAIAFLLAKAGLKATPSKSISD